MIAGILGLIIFIAVGGGIVFTIVQRSDEPVDRGAAVQRLYLYLVSLISYITALFGLDGVLRTLADVWLGGGEGIYTINADSYVRQQLARTAGILLVATLVFLLHWGFIQGRRTQPGEVNAALRKLFLYVALGFTVGFALTSMYELLRGIIDLAFGVPIAQSSIWPSEWLHFVTITTAALGLAAYLRDTIVNDGDYNAETNRAAGLWRKLYFLIASLTGLTLILWGTTTLIESLLRTLLDRFSAILSVSDGILSTWSDPIAQLLLGSVLLRFHWRAWQSLAQASPAERTSSVRRLYLYAAVVISAIFALVGAATFLDALLLRLFGANDNSWLQIAQQTSMSLAAILPGVVAWRWYWQQVHQESQWLGAGRDADTVRRIYYYAIAATGLGLLWIGAGTLVQVLLDWALSGDLIGQGLWREPLANGLSLLAVGAPIWSMHWRTVQPVARQENESGALERGSLPRRVYLYGVALIGALVILYYLAQVVYRFFLMILGEPNAAFFSPVTADEVARSVIAAIIWGLHMLALRSDLQMGGHAPAARMEEQRRELEAKIARLERELTMAREELSTLQSEFATQPLQNKG